MSRNDHTKGALALTIQGLRSSVLPWIRVIYRNFYKRPEKAEICRARPAWPKQADLWSAGRAQNITSSMQLAFHMRVEPVQIGAWYGTCD
jgi:hypothetical protein